jgi:hypothetical protein
MTAASKRSRSRASVSVVSKTFVSRDLTGGDVTTSLQHKNLLGRGRAKQGRANVFCANYAPSHKCREGPARGVSVRGTAMVTWTGGPRLAVASCKEGLGKLETLSLYRCIDVSLGCMGVA